MKDSYKECLILLRDLTSGELIELQYSVSKHIYIKSIMEHIQQQKMQPFIEELAKQVNNN